MIPGATAVAVGSDTAMRMILPLPKSMLAVALSLVLSVGCAKVPLLPAPAGDKGRAWILGIQPDLVHGHGYVQDASGQRRSLPKECVVDSGYAAPLVGPGGKVVVITGCLDDRDYSLVVRDGVMIGRLDASGLAFAGENTLIEASGGLNESVLLQYDLDAQPMVPREVARLRESDGEDPRIVEFDVTRSADRAAIITTDLNNPEAGGKDIGPASDLWVLRLPGGARKRLYRLAKPAEWPGPTVRWTSDNRQLVVEELDHWVIVDAATGKPVTSIRRPMDWNEVSGRCSMVAVSAKGVLAWCPGARKIIRLSFSGLPTTLTWLDTDPQADSQVSIAVDASGW